MSKVPCGMTLGHGERCVAGHLCGGCEEITRLRTALLHMRGFLKLWSDDVDAGLKPTLGSLSDARRLLAVALEGDE